MAECAHCLALQAEVARLREENDEQDASYARLAADLARFLNELDDTKAEVARLTAYRSRNIALALRMSQILGVATAHGCRQCQRAYDPLSDAWIAPGGRFFFCSIACRRAWLQQVSGNAYGAVHPEEEKRLREDNAVLKLALAEESGYLKRAEAEVARLTQEQGRVKNDDPEQGVVIQLLAHLSPECGCAVCDVLREHCEETFGSRDDS
jgi:hypothetical protein